MNNLFPTNPSKFEKNRSPICCIHRYANYLRQTIMSLYNARRWNSYGWEIITYLLLDCFYLNDLQSTMFSAYCCLIPRFCTVKVINLSVIKSRDQPLRGLSHIHMCVIYFNCNTLQKKVFLIRKKHIFRHITQHFFQHVVVGNLVFYFISMFDYSHLRIDDAILKNLVALIDHRVIAV